MNKEVKYLLLGAGIVFLMGAANGSREGSASGSAGEEKDQKRTIEVTGSATMEIEPDEITVSFTLQEYYNNAAKKKIDLVEIEKEFKQSLIVLGIEESDYTFNDLNTISYWRNWYWWYDEATDTRKSKDISVRFTDPEKIKALPARINMKGITNIYISKLDHGKMTDFRRDVKKEAIKMAYDKAQYLLEAVNEKPGRVISITEINGDTYAGFWGGAYGSMASNSYNSIVSSPSAASGNGEKTETIDLRYEVKAVFSIE